MCAEQVPLIMCIGLFVCWLLLKLHWTIATAEKIILPLPEYDILMFHIKVRDTIIVIVIIVLLILSAVLGY
jgi:hypothetical protein